MSSPNIERLPDRLKSILTATNSRTEAFARRQAWRNTKPVDYICRLRKAVPSIQVASDGEDVWFGTLSPGCRACKDGSWDCIFITMRCNLNCSFCLRPHSMHAAPPTSVFGRTPAEAAQTLARLNVKGVSFSGGEPLLEPDMLFDWLFPLRRGCPETYFWIYTNGLVGDYSDFQRLRQAGIQEMRFNMAACGYRNAAALDRMKMAAAIFPAVTIEIPAIPAHRDLLLAAIPAWISAGATYLNLHELIFQKGSNSGSMKGESFPFTMPDGHTCRVGRGSRNLTATVIQHIHENKLPINVNDCSMQSKIHQLRGRRHLRALVMRKAFERVHSEGLLETIAVWQGSDDVRFVHPDTVNLADPQWRGWNLMRIGRLATLQTADMDDWVLCETVK